MVTGVVLLFLAVGVAAFILVEGEGSCGCLACLIVPLAMAVAGVYLIVTDTYRTTPEGTVLGRYRGLAVGDEQGVVIPTTGRPYQVKGTSGATVGLRRVNGRETLQASRLSRPRGAPTYQGCMKAVDDSGLTSGAPLATLRPGQTWCTRDFGEYEDDRALRLLTITGVRPHPARVIFNVTVWKVY